jgi:hypothetical protein
MLVHLFHALAGLPLWACYASVGGLLAICRAVLLLIDKNSMARIEVVPPKRWNR